MTHDEKNTAINHLLRDARKQAGISLADAAKHLGITTASLSRMETGHAQVTANRLFTLAGFYGHSVSGLLNGKILTAPTELDMGRLRGAVLLVQEVIAKKDAEPSAEKIAYLVAEVFRRDVEQAFRLGQPSSAFDQDAHREFVEMALSA